MSFCIFPFFVVVTEASVEAQIQNKTEVLSAKCLKVHNWHIVMYDIRLLRVIQQYKVWLLDE